MKIKNYLLNIIGSSMLAFGVCAFIVPFDIIVGGATGISIIGHKLTGINMSTIVLAINIAVLPLGYIFSGKELVLGSILSSFVYPIALGIFERIPSITTLADNMLMACICGGVVCGAGIGLVMKSGGSTGGLDIPVLLVAKLVHLPVSKVMNANDVVIMLCQVPFSSVTHIIYGILYTWIMTQSLNEIMTLGADRLKVEVISESFDEIRHALIDNDFGVTMSYVQSGYTHTDVMKIESIMVSSHYRLALRIIESIDPTSFVTVSKVKDVQGRGYTIEREWIDMQDE